MTCPLVIFYCHGVSDKYGYFRIIKQNIYICLYFLWLRIKVYIHNKNIVYFDTSKFENVDVILLQNELLYIQIHILIHYVKSKRVRNNYRST